MNIKADHTGHKGITDRRYNGLRIISIDGHPEHHLAFEKEQYALLINLGEFLTVHHNGRTISLPRHQKAIVVLDGTEINLIGTRQTSYTVLAFEDEYIQRTGLASLCVFNKVLSDRFYVVDYIPGVVNKIIELRQTSLHSSLLTIYIEAKVTLILCLVLDAIRDNSSSTADSQPVSDQYAKVLLAKELIENNLEQTYTIAFLSKKVGTNEQYLKRYFKKYVGKTIFDFITECKMNQAKLLLKTTDLKISQIAQQVGYKHPTHFTSAFKRFFGYIPNTIRYSMLYLIDNFSVLTFFEEIPLI